MSSDEVAAALSRARRAQAEIEFWPQERVDEMVAAVGWHAYEASNARNLSELAHRETGMGDPEHLFVLHRRRVLGALRDLHGVVTTGVIEELPEQGLRKLAKPIGVIAVASPATAPCSGVIGNVLPMLKTRNAVVVSPNPRARSATESTVVLLRHALSQVGAPTDLVQCITGGGRQNTEELMGAADLVVAAGGEGTVRRAYRSGTPAISAGAGNPTIIVDESADLAAAAEQIVYGASFNHGTSCSSESNVLVDARVAEAFREQLARYGGHLCDEVETGRLRALLWPDGTRLNRVAVGRAAAAIADDADIDLDSASKIVVLVARGPDAAALVPARPATDPILGEKLSPVFTLLTYNDFETAMSAAEAIVAVHGRGHSCGIHTTRTDRVARLAERVRVCRIMENQSTATGNSGSFDNGMPFTSTISSGSWGGCSQSGNITWQHFLNYTYVSCPLPPTVPDEQKLFEPYRRRMSSVED